MKRISTLEYKGKRFEIVSHAGYYHTIDKDFIENGHLICELNGIQTMASTTISRAIESRKMQMDFEYMLKEGLDIQVIIKILTLRSDNFNKAERMGA